MNPLVGFGWVDGTKLWRNANFVWKLSEASRETFVLEALFYEIWRKPRTKTLVLEACSVKFRGGLAQNVRFGGLFFEISRKPRTKRLFWKLVL